MSTFVAIGKKIPSFEVKDSRGNLISSQSLLGHPFVLYFYPKDDTPGCTKEACSFRDNLESLASDKIKVFGISPDSSYSHQKFIDKYNLNFTLLSDETKEVCKKFDVLQEKTTFGKTSIGVVRTTFLVDKKGIIQWIERPVSVEGHVDRVKEAVKEL